MPLFTHGDAKAKLLILFFLKSAEIDVTSDQVYKGLYCLNFINYFEYCNAIVELKQESYIAEVPRAFGQSCKLTIAGKEALELFGESIPLSQREAIRRYIGENMSLMQQEAQLTSSMEESEQGGYSVRLTASEGKLTILDITMQVASREMAIEMRKNWTQQSCDIYNCIYSNLLQK